MGDIGGREHPVSRITFVRGNPEGILRVSKLNLEERVKSSRDLDMEETLILFGVEGGTMRARGKDMDSRGVP